MQLCHTVDGMAPDGGQVGHAHPPPAGLVDQGQAGHPGLVAEEAHPNLVQESLIDLVDDLHVAREQALEQGHGPGLQGLREQGVVGEGEGPAGDVPGLVPGHGMVIHEHAHQFRDGDGGMGVVELDGELLVEAGQAALCILL